MDNAKLQVVTFRATDEQIKRLRVISRATGKKTSVVMRDIVDSALLIEKPVVVSNYSQQVAVVPCPMSQSESV